jgi:WD40 repeat protein
MSSLFRFSPDGTRLWGAAPDRVKVRCVTWPEQTDLLANADALRALAANRTGLTAIAVGRTWAAVASEDGTVKLIPASDPTGPWKTVSPGKDNTLHSVALSPDESLVLAGTRQGQVAGFRLPGGEPLDSPIRHLDRVEAVAFAPDGKLVATGGRDNAIRLWERSGEQFRAVVTYPTAGPVSDLEFSPDGRRLAFVVEGQRAFSVWDLGLFRQTLAALGLDW